MTTCSTITSSRSHGAGCPTTRTTSSFSAARATRARATGGSASVPAASVPPRPDLCVVSVALSRLTRREPPVAARLGRGEPSARGLHPARPAPRYPSRPRARRVPGQYRPACRSAGRGPRWAAVRAASPVPRHSRPRGRLRRWRGGGRAMCIRLPRGPGGGGCSGGERSSGQSARLPGKLAHNEVRLLLAGARFAEGYAMDLHHRLVDAGVFRLASHLARPQLLCRRFGQEKLLPHEPNGRSLLSS